MDELDWMACSHAAQLNDSIIHTYADSRMPIDGWSLDKLT